MTEIKPKNPPSGSTSNSIVERWFGEHVELFVGAILFLAVLVVLCSLDMDKPVSEKISMALVGLLGTIGGFIFGRRSVSTSKRSR